MTALIIFGTVLLLAAVLFIVFLLLIRPAKMRADDLKVMEGHLFAHRGLYDNRTAPENSLKAFELAVEKGDGIELDIRLSADDEVVVFHDDDLYRFFGESTNVIDLSYEKLREYDLVGTGQHIPLFSETLELVAGRSPLIVEIKHSPKPELLCERAFELLDKYEGWYCIESFDPKIMRWVRKNRPGVVRGQLSGVPPKPRRGGVGFFSRFAAANLLINALSRPHFIAYDISNCGKLAVRLCGRMGAAVVPYTVTTKRQLDAARPDFTSIIYEEDRIK